MLHIIVHFTIISDIRRCHRWEPWVDISFNSIDGACSSANYSELLQAFTRCDYQEYIIRYCLTDLWSNQAVCFGDPNPSVRRWDDGRVLRVPGDDECPGGRGGRRLYIRGTVQHRRSSGLQIQTVLRIYIDGKCLWMMRPFHGRFHCQSERLVWHLGRSYSRSYNIYKWQLHGEYQTCVQPVGSIVGSMEMTPIRMTRNSSCE